MTPNDGHDDDSHETVRRRSVLAGAGALAAGGLVGTARAGGGTPDEVVFEGLTHRPLGDANLSTDTGSLEVSNLDDTGDDGVAVETEGTTAWTASTGTTFGWMPVGGQFLTRAHDPDGNVCTEARFTRTNSSLEIVAGFRSDNEVRIGIADNEADASATMFNKIENPILGPVELDPDGPPDWLIGIVTFNPGVTAVPGIRQTEDDDGNVRNRFGVRTSERVEFAVGNEIVEGDTLTVTELSDGGACEYGEIRNRTVGTDEFTFVSESVSE